MIEWKIILAIVVVILVVIIYWNKSMCSGATRGFWIADPDFCQEAEIDSLIMKISKNDAYILGIKDGEIFINENTGINMSNATSTMGDNFTAKISFLDIENEQFPKKATIKVYPYVGKLMLYDKDNNLYGVFYKDGSSTELQEKMEKNQLAVIPEVEPEVEKEELPAEKTD